MVNLHVSYEQLTNEATGLDTSREDINSQLNQLRTRIQNLTSGGFVTDAASVRYNQSFEQFTLGATQTIDALADLANMLRQTATTLQDTDQQLAQQMGG